MTRPKHLDVIWGSNRLHVYVMGNEFGATHVLLAEHESEAWELWADTQDPCDHGDDPEVLAKVEAGDDDIGCDCHMRDDGQYIWDVYAWMRSHGRIEHFLGAILYESGPGR